MGDDVILAVIDPPEEVTPKFGTRTGQAFGLACTADGDGRVLLANSSMWQPGVGPYIDHVTLSDGRGISTGPEVNYWLVWDAATGVLLHRLPGQSVGLTTLAWGRLADGRLALATVDNDRAVRVWDVAAGEAIGQFGGIHAEGPGCVGWLHGPNGRGVLATGGRYDGAVRIWDPLARKELQVLPGHGRNVNLVAEGRLAGGQRCLLTGGSKAPARIWDPDSGVLLRTLAAPETEPKSEANEVWSGTWGRGPDGPLVAVGSGDGSVRIWDPETGELLRTLLGHKGTVYSLAWADHLGWPSILVSADGEGTARIWDAGSGAEVARLPSKLPSTDAVDLARSPEGDLLLVIANGRGSENPARVWRIAPASLASRPSSTSSAAPSPSSAP